MKAAKERRKSRRVPYVCAIRFLPLPSPNALPRPRQIRKGTCVDLSDGGCGLRIKHPPLKQGCRVTAWIPVKGSSITLPVRSIVVRTTKASRGAILHGLQFF
jgi:c-di-GMP-binding flagellar brake protein YcgR